MKLSLSQKIIFTVIGTILFFGSLATYAVFYYNKSFLSDNLEERVTVITKDRAQDVDNVISNTRLLSRSIAENQTVIGFLQNSEENNFLGEDTLTCLNFYDEKEIYSAIYIMDKEGYTLVSTESTFIGNNYGFRDYFQKSISGEPYVDISLGVTSKKLGYYFSHPVRDENEEILGVVVVKLNPQIINNFLADFNDTDFSNLMVVDDRGIIFYSSDQTNLYHSLGELSSDDLAWEKEKRFPEVELFTLQYNEIQEELSAITDFKLFKIYDAEDEANKYFGVAPVQNGPFYVVIEDNFDQYASSAIYASYILAFFVIVSAFISGILISLFIIRFLRPIKELNKAAKAASRDDFKVQVNINTGTKDLDALSSSFNLMMKNVKQSRDSIHKEVKEKTKEITDKQFFMEDQQKAVLNILEDVDEARSELNQKYIEVDVIKDLTQKLGLSIDPLQIMDYLVSAIHNLFPDLIITHTELFTEAERDSRVVHVHTPFNLTKECTGDLKARVLKGFNRLPENIKSKTRLKKWLDQDFKLKIFKEKNASKKECLIQGDFNIIFMVPGVITSSVNISAIEKEVVNESVKKAIDIVFDNAKQMVGNIRDLVTSEHSRLEDLMESMTNGVLMFDLNGKVITANAAFTQMTGLPKEEIDLIDFLRFFKKDKKDVLSKIQKDVLENGNVIHFDEIEMARFTYEVYIAPMKDYQNKISGGVIVLHDITQMKAVDKMKTEFVSVASHQLRTPLTAMNWFIEMLLSGDAGKLTHMQKNYLDEVSRGSNRMVKLVNDLLNVSRLETGRLRVDPKPTDIVKFVKDIIEEAKPLSRKKGCEIIFDKPKKKLPKIPVDPGLMRQVVHNLVTNAIKYSKDKSCNIKVELKRRKNDYLVSVADSGIGISKEDQAKLFDKFFRADAAVQMSAEGTGLGLYIVKMIAEASGGKIWLESEVGKGSTFYVTMPIKGMKKQEGEKGLA